MFGLEKMELGKAAKLMLIISILLAFIAGVALFLGFTYIIPTGLPILLNYDFLMFFSYSAFYVKFYGIIPISLISDPWVVFGYKIIWENSEGITLFRYNTTTFLSLVAFIITSLTASISFGGLYASFIYQFRKSDYKTLGAANKILKEMIKNGTKEEKATIFSRIIFLSAIGIFLTIAIVPVLWGSIAFVNFIITYGNLSIIGVGAFFSGLAIWLVIGRRRKNHAKR